MGTPVEDAGSGNTDPTEAVQGITPDQSDSPGLNPAWESVLNQLPAEFHKVVTPHFAEWDKAANARVEGVNSQLERYKDYQRFVDHGIDGETLTQGLNIYQMINENPKAVYEALAQQLNITNPAPESASAGAGSADYTEEASQYNLPPDYEKLQAGVETMAGMLLQQQQEREQAQATAELESDLANVKSKYGEFNEAHFLPYLSHALGNGETVEKAAENFFAMRDELARQAQAPYAPKVLGANSGGGSGLPSNQINVRELGPKERRALVVQMLERNAQQNAQ